MVRALVPWLLFLAGCAAAPRELVLVEMRNGGVDGIQVALSNVESRKMWKEGHRVTVELATLFRIDAASNTVVSETFSAGDEVVLGGARWSIARVEPGTHDTEARVVLRACDP